jgi:hypothetical protein
VRSVSFGCASVAVATMASAVMNVHPGERTATL